MNGEILKIIGDCLDEVFKREEAHFQDVVNSKTGETASKAGAAVRIQVVRNIRSQFVHQLAIASELYWREVALRGGEDG